PNRLPDGGVLLSGVCVKYANTTASVTSVIRDLIPLHASTTSSFLVSNELSGLSSMMFPCRSTGIPRKLMDHTAQRDANNCSGNAILLKMIAGIGIARNSKPSGTSSHCSSLKPQK